MPNVLMIAVDDMNDWTSVLRGYGGTIQTPNFDRLAASGVSFSNAFTPLPVCNGARSATLTGMSPLSTGIFGNQQVLFDTIDPGLTLPAVLREAGYETATAGKVFHHLPAAVSGQLFDHVLLDQEDPRFRAEYDPANLEPTATTFEGGIFQADPDLLYDSALADRIEAFLRDYAPAPGSAGLFLSAGIKHPHDPLVAPPEFYALYPLDSIVLPDDPANELADLPAAARNAVNEATFNAIMAAGDWRALVQAYLASISYADAIVGRLLDAVAASAIADDTMVVLWSDNGFHLGEKNRVGKNSLWEESTRVSLMIADPGAPASEAGRLEEQVVSLVDVFPTVLAYLGLPKPAWNEGHSLLDLVRTDDATGLPGYAFTVQDGRYEVRTGSFSYIRYEDGSQELYDMRTDPGQHVNLADRPAQAATEAALSGLLDEYLSDHGVVYNNTRTPMLLQAAGTGVVHTGFGADTVVGGEGDNRYVIRGNGVVIQERADDGHDLIQARGSFELPANVEDLERVRLFSRQSAADAAQLTGNALDNRIAAEYGRNAMDGRAGNDSLTGALEADTLSGGAGDDLLTGDNGDDSLVGGAGRDTALGGSGLDVLSGGDGEDWLVGDSGNDMVGGGAGDDTLWGDTGRDTLVGGAGRDLLYGGGNPDLVRFLAIADGAREAAQADRLMDFAAGDLIDLRPIDANAVRAGDQRFHAIGDAAFSRPGELRIWQEGGVTWVALNVDRDGAPDLLIAVEGAPPLSAADFWT